MRKLALLAIPVLLIALGLANQAFGATGGPDAGGYTFIDNNSPGGPVYNFDDIRGTGTHLAVENDDDEVQSGISLGFTFNFYGTNYTAVNISTNGNLQFGTANDEYSNESLPTTEFRAAILPWWDDLDGGECLQENLVYQTKGSAPNRRFIMQWDTCHNDEPNDEQYCKVNFEAILFETTNHILFQYQDTVFSPQGNPTCNGDTGPHSADFGAEGTIGIQESSAVALQYSFDSASLADGRAICFLPPNSTTLACGTGVPPTPTSTATATATSTRVPAPTERPRVNVGGGVGAVVAAAGEQARENRAGVATAAAPQPTAQVRAPSTGTGVSIAPPNTGDGGLAASSGNGVVTVLALVVFAVVLASVAGLRLPRR